MKKIFKGLLLSLLLVSSPAIFSFSNVVNVAKISSFSEPNILDQELFEKVKTELLANKEYLKSHEFIDFNNQSFYSIDQLNQYLFDNQLINRELTSSNPLKIFQNQDFVLDENQIYDLNHDNFNEVYRTAWGDVAYSLDEALQTYVNPGNIVQEYSYNDFDWYRSASDAERAIKKGTLINKSLYYLFNSQYYNAFNPKDINDLVGLMKTGLYIKRTHTLWGTKLSQPDYIYGSYDIVRALLKTRLEKEWKNYRFLDKITTANVKNSITVTPRYAAGLKIRYLSDINGYTYNLPAEEVYWNGETVTLNLDTSLGSKGQVLSSWTDRSQWSRDTEWYASRRKDYLHRNFKLLNDNGKWYNATITLLPTYLAVAWGDNTPNVQTWYVNNPDQSATINFYYDSAKKENQTTKFLLEQKDVNEIAASEKTVIFNEWFDWYFNNVILDFGTGNERFNFDDLKQGKFLSSNTVGHKDIIGEVYRDVSYEVNYGKGYTQSLINTYNSWLNDRKIILDHPIIKDGQNFYNLNTAVDDNGIENYLLLTYEQLMNYIPIYGNVPVSIMYSYSSQIDPKDRFGITLAKTEAEARQKELIANSKTLFTHFVFYDRYGHEIVNRNSIKEAIKAIQNELKISAKYVHKNEIASWTDKDSHAWNDVVSDGVYEVYWIKNSYNPNKKLYFISQQAALNALKSDLMDSEGKYLRQRKDFYSYEYLTTSGVSKIITFTLDKVNQIVEQIMDEVML